MERKNDERKKSTKPRINFEESIISGVIDMLIGIILLTFEKLLG